MSRLVVRTSNAGHERRSATGGADSDDRGETLEAALHTISPCCVLKNARTLPKAHWVCTLSTTNDLLEENGAENGI